MQFEASTRLEYTTLSDNLYAGLHPAKKRVRKDMHLGKLIDESLGLRQSPEGLLVKQIPELEEFYALPIHGIPFNSQHSV